MKKPTCADGDKDFTIVYTDPYSDWIAGVAGILPAHVAEQKSGVEDIIAAVEADDTAALHKVAEFWNNGWRFNPGEIDPAITPSSGPYKLGAWEPGQSITLVANDKYWGTPRGGQEHRGPLHRAGVAGAGPAERRHPDRRAAAEPRRDRPARGRR